MVDNNTKVRVRYAPSPTGHLHIGNARTAIFNYLFARHNKGEFIIRIEDTDQVRNIADGEKSQLDNLKWLGLDWDEGPDKPNPKYGDYHQSNRGEFYQKYLTQLLDEGKAYYSYMTEEELAEVRERQKANHETPHYEYEYAGMSEAEIKEAQAKAQAAGLTPVVRFRVPDNEIFKFDDIVKGNIEFNSNDIGGDFVIQKRDGMPTYNFAVVVDDHLMEITHVLRGDDHIANTPKQMMIYKALGWETPEFGHMTLIINNDTGKKLSKRDENILQFIEQYKDLGYLADAMFNFIVLLGWSPVGEDEIFTKKQFIKNFDPKRLSKSPASFDNRKLEWINNQYIKHANPDVLMDLALTQLIKASKISDNPDSKTIQWLESVIGLYLDHMSYAAQIVDFSEMFFATPALNSDTAEELRDGDAAVVIKDFKDKIADLKPFNSQKIMNAIKSVQQDTGVKGRKLYMPIRIATTKSTHGPAIGKTIELIGKDEVMANIDDVLATL